MIEFILTTTLMSYPISFIMQLIYEFRLYKFLADYGYKTNFTKSKEIMEDINCNDYSYANRVNSLAIPFYNIYSILKRGLDLVYIDSFVLSEYEKKHIIVPMTNEEKQEYAKSRTGLKAFLIGMRNCLEETIRFVIGVNLDGKIIKVLIQYDVLRDEIKIISCDSSELKPYEKEIEEKVRELIKNNEFGRNKSEITMSAKTTSSQADSKISKLEQEKEYYERLVAIIEARSEETMPLESELGLKGKIKAKKKIKG